MTGLRNLALSLIFSCGISSSLEAETVRIASGEWAPFASELLPDHGPVNSLINQVFKEAGYDTTFIYLPWKRALNETRLGRYVATSFWYYNAEREADFIHVGPVSQETLAFLRLRTTPEPAWTSLADLADYRIGAVAGLTYTTEFRDLAQKGALDVRIGPNDEANLRKLLAGRIDLYPVSLAVARYILATKFTAEERAQFEVSKHTLSVVKGYILFARSAPNVESIVRDFEAALKQRDDSSAIDEQTVNLSIDSP